MTLSRSRAFVRPLSILSLLVLVGLAAATPAQAQVSVTTLGTPVTENFNTLASSGTSSVLPAGWAFSEAGTNANATYTAGTGSGTAGDTYSFGASISTERAFGGLQSGSLIPTIGAAFTNNTGATISRLDIAYTGEQWRLGTSGRADRIDFQYSLNATSLTNGTWVDVDALDFNSPITVGTVGALDGNLPANRTPVAGAITGLSIPNGATFWIRWTDFNATGADDGLAVDDFSLTASKSTDPTGVGAASPSLVQIGDMPLLTVTVTPGTNPASTGLAVTANLSAIGGGAAQSFFDDGTHGDVTAGDLVFSYLATVGVGTTGGSKSLPATITDAQARSGAATIAIDVQSPTNPTGVGSANPVFVQVGGTSLLTVSVTPGANPTSTGLAVTADLTAIGGTPAQTLYDDGTHGDVTAGNLVFSYLATVGAGTTGGSKSLPATITDAQARTGSATIALDVQSPPSPTLVVSQVYGGGGNVGATYTHDFIELYNRGSVTVSVTGWSVQYASSAGTSWQVTALSGTIPPGQYYLVQEAVGAGGTTPLPAPDAIGAIPMAATAGKVALVSSTTALVGGCPVSASILDFVGYGSASCSETAPTATLSNTTAAIRNGAGSVDTNNNFADFSVAAPAPRNSSGFVPTGLGAASPGSASPGETTLLTVAVTPGASPPSATLAVSANLTPIGGAATQAFFDDGSNGDALAGDKVFSFLATVGLVPVGSKTLTATVSDDLGRSSFASIPFGVEPPITAIHDIQGAGLTSPVVGQFVATQGIVTGVKFNGFFVQTPDAQADADPNTSEGIFVFTSSTPSGLNVGDGVKVTGTVQEFVPSADPSSPPTTELISPATTVLTTGNPLPAAVTLTAADTSPGGTIEQLERFEGMRVHVDALRVIAPTQGSVNEPSASSTSNGTFYGVIDGVARPFREPGVEVPDPLPASAPCCVPRFDANPERLRVDSDALVGGVALEVTTGALLSNVTGPLDYGFRTYTILPDPATPPSVSGNVSATPVPEPSQNEFTVGSFNMERFFDSVNDPAIGEPVLTPAAFDNRLNKASLAIRNVMRTPDILGVEEVENLSTLQTLAARVNLDAVNAGQPDPAYVAYLEEGNDVGGIDSGFLVKSARVALVDVTQVNKTETYINPNTGLPELLNDRPPLVLRATVPVPDGSPFPVTVIVNHLRSLNGVDSVTDGRVRAKRAAQAESLANLIQARQAAGERVVSVGDYNAFQFNDGYVDSLGTITGNPAPPNQVVVASPDLVDPNLTNLVDTLAADQRYSYSFDGNAQVLDHVLVNARLMPRFSRFAYARNDADFPESYRNDAARPERLSDHDMPVAYFMLPGAPGLTLQGANPMTVECHTPFADPGATASDSDLGDLTSQIQVTGSVDADTVGAYVLSYSVSNGFLTTTMTRTVNVVDTTPPALTLLGSNPLTIELGGTYVEAGATAVDSCAGDLTGAIQTSGSVNTGQVGAYYVSYTVSDGYNTTAVTRTVNVVDTTAPAIASVSASPNTIWPPNNKMVPVTISVSASDLSGTPSCSIVSVSSNEVDPGSWSVTGPLTLQVKASRNGNGSGRVYTIGVRCTDASGNASNATTTVNVPHDQRK